MVASDDRTEFLKRSSFLNVERLGRNVELFLLLIFRGGMTEKEFIDSKAWRKKREYILRRDGYQCQYCKRYGRRREATEVHHIKHYSEFPELGLVNENLVSLCHACHNKQHPEKGGARRYERRVAR